MLTDGDKVFWEVVAAFYNVNYANIYDASCVLSEIYKRTKDERLFASTLTLAGRPRVIVQR